MIVLYMLKRCEMPLSKSQIYDFILEKEYTTFLTLQEVFSELSSASLIIEKTMGNRTYLEITPDGEQTLSFFGNRLNPAIKQQIDEYLTANSMKIVNEAAILGDYKKTGDNEYQVKLIARENGQELVNITIPVPTEEIAQNVLDKWQEQNQDIYMYLVNKLMS